MGTEKANKKRLLRGLKAKINITTIKLMIISKLSIYYNSSGKTIIKKDPGMCRALRF